ncbi:NAD(P)-dependent oxidoreductase [Salinibacter altiplanensis]|uniref:NAD(P)-dependent oxidoreductase n=1 Tax=Salinibacter altiplanensis TaxID=1803181 RepID=UPI0018F8B32B|nr:NAD(P)-dependent oxidoreductase [Salinibacter altiplanensis]
MADEQLCVVGVGALGWAIATRADGLGMDVAGVKRTPVPIDHIHRVYPTRGLREALQDARFVVLAVPLTEETEDTIGRPQLSAMPEDDYLINVARGAGRSSKKRLSPVPCAAERLPGPG